MNSEDTTEKSSSLPEALWEFYQEAMGLLREQFPSDSDLPTYIMRGVKISADGVMSETDFSEIEWFRIVDAAYRDIEKTESYGKCLKTMEQDERIAVHLNKMVGTCSSRGRVEGPSLMRSFLLNMLYQQKSLDPPEAEIRNLCQACEAFFYEDTLTFRCFTPVYGLKMDVEKIDLGTEVSLVKISTEEKEKMLTQRQPAFFPHSNMESEAAAFANYALQMELKTPKIIEPNEPEPGQLPPVEMARKAFEYACSTLRLFKAGYIGLDYVRLETASWQPQPYSTSSPSGDRKAAFRRSITYDLSKEEISGLLDLFAFVQDRSEADFKTVGVALRRLNFSYDRSKLEDKLIDLVVGLESLLLTKNERQELRYRLALRGSALLAKTADAREMMFNELYAAYGQRNVVVHGGAARDNVKVGEQEIPFPELVLKTEQRLRDTIMEYIRFSSRGVSAKEVTKILDQRVVRGGEVES